MVKFALITFILLFRGHAYSADISDSERLDLLMKKFDDLSNDFNDLAIVNKV